MDLRSLHANPLDLPPWPEGTWVPSGDPCAQLPWPWPFFPRARGPGPPSRPLGALDTLGLTALDLTRPQLCAPCPHVVIVQWAAVERKRVRPSGRQVGECLTWGSEFFGKSSENIQFLQQKGTPKTHAAAGGFKWLQRKALPGMDGVFSRARPERAVFLNSSAEIQFTQRNPEKPVKCAVLWVLLHLQSCVTITVV